MWNYQRVWFNTNPINASGRAEHHQSRILRRWVPLPSSPRVSFFKWGIQNHPKIAKKPTIWGLFTLFMAPIYGDIGEKTHDFGVARWPNSPILVTCHDLWWSRGKWEGRSAAVLKPVRKPGDWTSTWSVEPLEIPRKFPWHGTMLGDVGW